MNCVFCQGLVLDWETENSLRKPALHNRSLFDFFCRQIGVENSLITSLEKVPNCEDCYFVYNELQNVYIQLEDLKVQVDRHVDELKRRVVSTTCVINEGVNKASVEIENEEEKGVSDVEKFRKAISNSIQQPKTVYDVLAGCSGIPGIVKTEQHEVKLEPTDVEMDGFYEEDPLDEFEIHPLQGDKEGHQSPNFGDNDDSFGVADDDDDSFLEAEIKIEPTRRMPRRAKTQAEARKSRPISKPTGGKRGRPRKNKSPSSTPTTTKSPRGRKPGSGTSKPKAKAAEVKLKSKRLIISSDESDDGDDDNDGDQGSTTSDRKNKIPCPTCHKFFPKPSRLQRHQLIVHEKQKPFSCPVCQRGFARRHVYTMHMIQTHETEDKPFSCSICSKKFTLELLKDRHEGYHKFDETKPVACEYCDIRFKSDDKDGIEKHIQLVHTKRPNPFQCDQCNITFQNRNLLLRHDNQYHRDKFIYSCEICEKRYSIEDFLITHMKTHSDKGPYQCTVCKWEVLTAEMLGEHLLSHTGEKRLKCEDCQLRFFSMGELKRHRVHEHGAEKPFICKYCQKRYILNSDMTAHIREVHEGFPNQFSCEQCGKGFANMKYLKNHIKKIHELKKVVICELCGKRLADTSSLRDHMNSHNGIKPFVCSFCGQRFVKQNTLKCHILTHTGEKPFVCHICNKGYTQSHCLKTHLKSHGTTTETDAIRTTNKPTIMMMTDVAGTNTNSESNSNSESNTPVTVVNTSHTAYSAAMDHNNITNNMTFATMFHNL